MRNKISVIIPIYNMGKYLKQAIDSVLSQTLKEIEIICVNDGSTDSSKEILQEYQSENDRIKIIDQENHGVGYSRNVGIKAASGEFIAFLDPDDYLVTHNTYEKLYNAARKNNVYICGGSICEDPCTGIEMKIRFGGNIKKQIFSEEGIFDYQDYQFDYGFCRFIYNREFLLNNKIFFPNYKRFQDPPFFVRAMITAKKFYAIKAYTYCYRLNHKTVNFNNEQINDLIRGLTDNLQLSSEANLKELHLLELERLNYDYRSWILAGYKQRNVQMFELLSKAQSYVKKEWVEDNYFKSSFDCIYLANEEQMKNITDLKNDLMEKELFEEEQKKNIADLKNDLMEKELSEKELMKNIADLKNDLMEKELFEEEQKKNIADLKNDLMEKELFEEEQKKNIADLKNDLMEKESFEEEQKKNIADLKNDLMEKELFEEEQKKNIADLKNNLMEKELSEKEYRRAIDLIYNSASWRVGNFLIQPFHFIKCVIQK